VADHLTEEEQIESLKAWWGENGVKTLVSIVLIVGGYFGYQSWDQNKQLQAEIASSIWQNSMDIVSSQAPGENFSPEQQTTINNDTDQLKNDHAGTGYAHFGAMLKAKIAVENDDLATAAAELQWSLDNDPEPATEMIVRLRLARVEAALGNVELALEMVQGIDFGTHKSAYEEAKGDFYLLLDNTEAAYTAYDAAIASNESSDPIVGNILELKIGQVLPAATPDATIGDDQ
jgi:predicted negative regulator of RcsB-dependent stress response